MTSEPRTVTLAQIEAEIASEHIFSAAEGQAGAVGLPRADAKHIPSELDTLTICVLVLKNGHKVVGLNHGAIDPTLHSSEMGREQASQDALAKVRDYLGFRLRDQIAAEAPAQPERKRYGRADIADLRWEQACTHQDPLGQWVSVWARMKDGQEIRTRFDGFAEAATDQRLSAMTAALQKANGEAT